MDVPEIDVQHLKAQRANILVVDCRRQEEWLLCKIDGALLCPLAEFAQHIDNIKTQSAGRQVVVYCHTGRRSLIATHLLRNAGLDAVSLHGGIQAWADIDPTIARY